MQTSLRSICGWHCFGGRLWAVTLLIWDYSSILAPPERFRDAGSEVFAVCVTAPFHWPWQSRNHQYLCPSTPLSPPPSQGVDPVTRSTQRLLHLQRRKSGWHFEEWPQTEHNQLFMKKVVFVVFISFFFFLFFFCATRWQWTHSNICLLQVKWRHEVAKHDLICGWNWGYWTQYEHTETEWGFLWECLSKTTSLTFRWEMKMTNSHADDFLPWVLQFPSMGSLAETTEQDFLLCHSPEVVSEKDNEHPLAFQVENTMCN